MDRDAARALFDRAEPTPLAPDGHSPFAATSPFAESDADLYDHVVGKAPQKKRIDWRYVAPIGVAAVCAGAVLFIVNQRDGAAPGKTVASAEIVQPVPAPIQAAQAPAPTDSSIVERETATTSPVRITVRAAPARRAPAPRVVASRPAPSASDASADVSARVPYVPPPSLGAPAEVTITPPPAPAPTPTPQPDPTTPQ
jgi:hypothetical protein